MLRNPSIWLVAAATFLFAAVQVSWIAYIPLYLSEVLGLSAVAAGAVLGQAQVGGALGRIFFGLMSDRVLGGRRLAVLVAAGLASAGLCLVTARLAPGVPAGGLSALALAFGLAGIGWNGVHHTLVAEIAGSAAAATAVGLVLAVSSAGVIVAPLAFGQAADALGGFAPGWYALAAAMTVAVLLLARVREPRRPTWT